MPVGAGTWALWPPWSGRGREEGFLELLSQGILHVPSDVVVVHLGSNDLARKNKSVIVQVNEDLWALVARFPGTKII